MQLTSGLNLQQGSPLPCVWRCTSLAARARDSAAVCITKTTLALNSRTQRVRWGIGDEAGGVDGWREQMKSCRRCSRKLRKQLGGEGGARWDTLVAFSTPKTFLLCFPPLPILSSLPSLFRFLTFLLFFSLPAGDSLLLWQPLRKRQYLRRGDGAIGADWDVKTGASAWWPTSLTKSFPFLKGLCRVCSSNRDKNGRLINSWVVTKLLDVLCGFLLLHLLSLHFILSQSPLDSGPESYFTSFWKNRTKLKPKAWEGCCQDLFSRS